MSGDEDPVAWLRAQIEARLALAREASPHTDGHWWRRTDEAGEAVGALHAGERVMDADGDVFGGAYIVVYDEGAPSDAQFDHIAANDPQDTIARCEAELAILDEHAPVTPIDRGDRSWQECGECGPNNDLGNVYAAPGPGEAFWPCRTVRLLASGYRHRPGYEEAWGS